MAPESIERLPRSPGGECMNLLAALYARPMLVRENCWKCRINWYGYAARYTQEAFHALTDEPPQSVSARLPLRQGAIG